jgi:hypothetical protein
MKQLEMRYNAAEKVEEKAVGGTVSTAGAKP